MVKRILSFVLSVILLIPVLAVPASAGEVTHFSDVTDQTTASTIEVLRLMGVLDGYADGTFRPAGQLTRAQFCKMATYATDSEASLGKYRTSTIFPDVKPSHWAAAYINLAAKGKGIIAGYPDGSFCPDRTVTVGQAVTILLRLLGYKDEEVGGVWPDSYMAAGAEIGLTEGIAASGNTPLTRAQAARLFLNLLNAKKNGGGTLYALSEETQLYSLDGATGELKTAAGTYKLAHPVSATSLIGNKGRVVLNAGGEALTFLPAIHTASGIANAAIVIQADRSAAGLSDLAGSTNYTLYKNGIQTGAGALRKYDVASYYPANNSIRVCDTRVTVYYEACEPSPEAPTVIRVLGGTQLSVLPTAMESLAKFKPGQQMTILLTADGQVAAAIDPVATVRDNAIAVVSDTGSIELLCGVSRIPLAAAAEEKYRNQVVHISSSAKDAVTLSVYDNGVFDDLDIDSKQLGNKKLAENVLIFDAGKQVTLSQLTGGTIPKESITAARTNWAGDIDLLVLNGGLETGVIYGKAVVRRFTEKGENGKEQEVSTLEILYGGKTTGVLKTGYAMFANNGDYVAATMKNGSIVGMTVLTKLKDVSNDSWVGTGSVLVGGKSYVVPQTVLCYNLDSGDWVTLEQAQAYAKSANLYVQDGIVRIVEVLRK